MITDEVVNVAQQQALPCPFCGAKPKQHKDEQAGSRWEYYCPLGHTGYMRMKEWNMRAVAPMLRDTWLPIETAPKDGSYVLLSGFDTAVWQGNWVGRSGRYEINGWTRFNSIDLSWEPTRWKPMPDPPKPDNHELATVPAAGVKP